MKTKILLTSAGIATLVVLSVTVARATPPHDATPHEVAQGALPGPTGMAARGIQFGTSGPTRVLTQWIEVKPGGTSGWHSHPGLVLVTLTSGAITFHDATCDSKIYATGASFIEPPDEPGMVTNDGDTPAIFYVMQIVPVGQPFRIDQPVPACGGDVQQ
jgi:quercetin dioxygenase-like cupin family protein